MHYFNREERCGDIQIFKCWLPAADLAGPSVARCLLAHSQSPSDYLTAGFPGSWDKVPVLVIVNPINATEKGNSSDFLTAEFSGVIDPDPDYDKGSWSVIWSVLGARHFLSLRHRDVRHLLNHCATAPLRRFFS